MSWDLFVQDWGNVNSLDEIPDDFTPQPIGQRSDFIARMQKIEPEIDFTDPSLGSYKNDHFSIQFGMGDDEELTGFVMHVRGDDLSLPFIGTILEELNVRATDGSSVHFFDVEKSKESLDQWIAFRNKVGEELSNNSTKKISSPLFVLLSILIQLAIIPIVYGFFESIASLINGPNFGLGFYFLTFPIVNYAIIFSVIIVSSIQETTKSELLASVMNVVWILFIYSETSDAFRNRPYEYILFLLCIALTIPVRIGFRKLYHP